MRKNLSLIVVGLIAIFLAYHRAEALRINPMSNAMTDSANSPGDGVLRDLNGDFAAHSITLTGAMTGSASDAVVITTTTLRSTVPNAIGSVFIVKKDNGTLFGTCVATAAVVDSAVYVSSNTATPATPFSKACHD